MKKEEYIKLQGILIDCHERFRSNYDNMQNGKNKDIRKKAERNVRNSIDLAITWINRYPDSFDLMMSENTTGMDKAIAWDEFQSISYFNRDMEEFLEKIDEKISSMD